MDPFTAKFSQKKILTKFRSFILWNFEEQIAPCVSTGTQLSFEWSHHRICINENTEEYWKTEFREFSAYMYLEF